MDETMSDRSTSVTQVPRVGHKKSRKGCLKCRARRVKCDETHPQCRNCQRLELHCSYARPPGGSAASPSNSSGGSPQASTHINTAVLARQDSGNAIVKGPKFSDALSNDTQSGDDILGDSKGRRLMELRLLHFWMSKQTTGPFQSWASIWMIEVPRLALQNDHLLFSLLAMAATQLAAIHPEDEELAVARQTYWTMALHEQQVTLQHPETMDREITSFAAYLINNVAFGMLRERTMEPYTPPMEWLDVSIGAKIMTPEMEEMKHGSQLRNMIDLCQPLFDDAGLQEGADLPPEYEHILDPSLSPGELSDLETLQTYEGALRYIGVFKKAISVAMNSTERGAVHARRIIVFPFIVPPLFITFVRECRPRALVILACFFAVAAESDGLRYFGDLDKIIPRREVSGINSVLPPEWRKALIEPLDETFTACMKQPFSIGR